MQPDGAVVQQAGEHEADHARAEGEGGGAEEGVDGRAGHVLPRAGAEEDGAVRHQQVAVGRGDIDPAALERLAVHRLG